jgi:hypothetical protein
MRSPLINPIGVATIFLLLTVEAQAQDFSSSDTSSGIGFLIGLVLWGLVGGGIGSAIGSQKGEAVMGFVLGFLFGPLGWIIALVSKGNRIKCPSCRELIDPNALVCPKCHTKLFNGSIAPPPSKPTKFVTRDTLSTERGEAAVPPPPPRRHQQSMVRVSRDGVDMGELTPQELCDMIVGGDLTLEDHFYNTEKQQWQTLDTCPLISIG